MNVRRLADARATGGTARFGQRPGAAASIVVKPSARSDPRVVLDRPGIPRIKSRRTEMSRSGRLES